MKKDNAGYKVVVAQLPNEYGRVVMLIFTAEMHVLLDSKNKCYTACCHKNVILLLYYQA